MISRPAQSAQSLQFVGADGREIEPLDHILENGPEPGKRVGKGAVKVEDGEAIAVHAASIVTALLVGAAEIVRLARGPGLAPELAAAVDGQRFAGDEFAGGAARKTLASAMSHGEPARIIGFERG